MKEKGREGRGGVAVEEGRRNHDGEERKKNKKKRKKKEEVSEVGEELIPTVSIAVAGSIVQNAQSRELATLLVGQIARAATIFRIDEVIVFDNKVGCADPISSLEDSEFKVGAPFFAKILHYLETPQYLRRSLFPVQQSLKYAGLLPPLDAPHHLRKHEWSPFREGVTLERGDSDMDGIRVNVGLDKNVFVEQVLEPGLRVTVDMGADRKAAGSLRKVVSSSSPRDEMGLYWGYKVRYASNFSSVFEECPYMGGYDHIIGTSEHGRCISSSELEIPPFRHLLIAFGGLGGLEENIEEDSYFKGKNAKGVFVSYLNTCPNQGSRTIRTEEAIFISLQYFSEPIARAVQRFRPKEEKQHSLITG